MWIESKALMLTDSEHCSMEHARRAPCTRTSLSICAVCCRYMLEADDEQTDAHTRCRKRIHPLSAKSPRYDMGLLALRTAAMLNTLFCAQLSDHRVGTASVRVVLGILMLALGWSCDCYFPPILKGWDQNCLQAGLRQNNSQLGFLDVVEAFVFGRFPTRSSFMCCFSICLTI